MSILSKICEKKQFFVKKHFVCEKNCFFVKEILFVKKTHFV